MEKTGFKSIDKIETSYWFENKKIRLGVQAMFTQLRVRSQIRLPTWFWSKKWQQMEKEADEDIKQGKVRKAKNLKELIRKLDD